MILVDSSVFISAFRTKKRQWLGKWIKDSGNVITCDLVRAEIKSGVLACADDVRRKSQLRWFETVFKDMDSRGLDRVLCDKAAELAGQARRNGFATRLDDALVAAAALAADAKVATSNVRHFEQLGVHAFNPLSEHLPDKASP